MFKGFIIFFIALTSVLIFGCNGSVSGTATHNSRDSSSTTSSASAGSSSSNIVSVKIPSTPGALPSGALEQVSFSPGGGLGPCVDICYDEGAFSGNTLKLSKFSPNQQLTLLVYSDPEGKYKATWRVQVDNFGSLTIILSNGDFSNYGIAIHDARSGDLLRLTRVMSGGDLDSSSDNSEHCSGAPPKRLSVGEGATVCTKNDSVNLRTGPNNASSSTHKLVPGAELQVIGGPVCDKQSSFWYWEVRTESGFKGWMAEGGDSIDPYFLCPNK